MSKKSIRKNLRRAAAVAFPIAAPFVIAKESQDAASDAKKKALREGGYLGQAAGSENEARAGLQREFDALPGLPGRLRETTLGEAQRAGTYSATNEFESGLQSEVQARTRGARADALRRIQELQKRLGIPLTEQLPV